MGRGRANHEKRHPKVVVAFGVFDLLHPGHVHFLESAARHGDRLIVVVTRDERCEIEKGRRPVFPLEERLRMVGALRCVSEAVAGDPPGEWHMLARLNPDVVCVGYDQDPTDPRIIGQLKGLPGQPEIRRISPFREKEYKSSKIRMSLGQG